MKFFKNHLVLIFKKRALNSPKLPKMLCRTGIKTFLMVSSKKIFLKNFKFLNFFAGPGS